MHTPSVPRTLIISLSHTMKPSHVSPSTPIKISFFSTRTHPLSHTHTLSPSLSFLVLSMISLKQAYILTLSPLTIISLSITHMNTHFSFSLSFLSHIHDYTRTLVCLQSFSHTCTHKRTPTNTHSSTVGNKLYHSHSRMKNVTKSKPREIPHPHFYQKKFSTKQKKN